VTHSARPTSPPSQGTRPPGASPGTNDEAAASRFIRKLFTDVSGRYDLLNHLLSFQIDRYWRRATARRFRAILDRPGSHVLDLCCGTADLTISLARGSRARIVSSDFCHPMLVQARQKLSRQSLPPFAAEADALRLPFAGATFDLVACSFGFRNLANYRAGLREILRVLKPGGEVGILEFGTPRGFPLGPLYSFYFHKIVPAAGEWISGVKGSYSYLASSVDRFPEPEELEAWMREAGYAEVSRRTMTGGIAVLYCGKRIAD
jgi:demethylmenaquinone methyltransferase/2-methoxy-6-polyprenyl-1,4-benzoquinol methylase